MAKTHKRSAPGNSAASPTATVDDPRNAAAGEADSAEADRERPTEGEPRHDVRMDDAHRERVARRAYELYLSRGGGHGSDWDDWLAAEREISDSPKSSRSGGGSGSGA